MHERGKDAYPFGEYHHVVMKEQNDTGFENYLKQGGRTYELEEVEPGIEDSFMALMKDNNE